MITPVPKTATKILYRAGSKRAYYFVWPAKNKWQWEALGNGGEENSLREATEKAKRWIKDRQ